MGPVKAIGFDLFNTLIMAEPGGLDEAMARLMERLRVRGIKPEFEPFKKAYRSAATHCIRQATVDGRETHNRFWISAALEETGYAVDPDDPRISSAVEAYFSAFFDFCRPIPGAFSMLETLMGSYRLGLLSNFTHAPAAVSLIDRLGFGGFFDAVLISGKIGYRKPHPTVFEKLKHSLGVDGGEMLYVGDDVEADIGGALNAGIQPIWFTYAHDSVSPLPPGAMSDSSKVPPPDIPIISNWGELLDLLRAVRLL